jgi:hypothetical protein
MGCNDTFTLLHLAVGAVDALSIDPSDPERKVRAMAVWTLYEINPSRSTHLP